MIKIACAALSTPIGGRKSTRHCSRRLCRRIEPHLDHARSCLQLEEVLRPRHLPRRRQRRKRRGTRRHGSGEGHSQYRRRRRKRRWERGERFRSNSSTRKPPRRSRRRRWPRRARPRPIKPGSVIAQERATSWKRSPAVSETGRRPSGARRSEGGAVEDRPLGSSGGRRAGRWGRRARTRRGWRAGDLGCLPRRRCSGPGPHDRVLRPTRLSSGQVCARTTPRPRPAHASSSSPETTMADVSSPGGAFI